MNFELVIGVILALVVAGLGLRHLYVQSRWTARYRYLAGGGVHVKPTPTRKER